jgi:alpha-beta hydrolase superfamily lysophospholipase
MMSVMRTETVTFPGADGQKLAARLDSPDEAARAYALFAHCFTCGKDVFAASRIAKRLSERGIAVLRFDFTGLGASEGEFANTNFSSNVADLIAAADHLRDADRAPTLLVGHSLGGAAVLAAAVHVPESKAVVTLAAPSDPAHVTGLFRDRLAEIEHAGEAEVELAGRSFKIKRQFLSDVAEQNLLAKVAALRRALLVMHSPADATVDVANAARIFTAAKHPKSFISLDGADHLLAARRDANYVADLIAVWSERYVTSQGWL